MKFVASDGGTHRVYASPKEVISTDRPRIEEGGYSLATLYFCWVVTMRGPGVGRRPSLRGRPDAISTGRNGVAPLHRFTVMLPTAGPRADAFRGIDVRDHL
jgi:hypothetical protein